MLRSPTTLSTSSGMWVHPMDTEVSISSMMFGFTCAWLVLVIGVVEISVCSSACDGEQTKASRLPADDAIQRAIRPARGGFWDDSWYCRYDRRYSTITWR